MSVRDRVAAMERIAPNAAPIFHVLFAMLPPAGDDFPAAERLAFLRAMAAAADVVYGPSCLLIEEERSDAQDQSHHDGEAAARVRSGAWTVHSVGNFEIT